MASLYDTPWRPAYEIYPSIAWFAAAVSTFLIWLNGEAAVTGPFVIIAALAFGFAVIRFAQSVLLWKRKLSLIGQGPLVVPQSQVIKKVTVHPSEIWMGDGFEWTAEHTQLAYDLKKASKELLEIPYVVKKAFEYTGLYRPPAEEFIGKAWIHGIAKETTDQFLPIKHTEGHLLGLATSGWGKTVMMGLLATQSIVRSPKRTVFIIDPKGDKKFKELAKRATEAHRPGDWLEFSLAHSQTSIRLDLLRKWNRPTEPATRLTALVPAENGGDAFSGFAWRVLNLVSQGAMLIDERPTIKTLKSYVEGGIDGLLKKSLEKHLSNHVAGWEEKSEPYVQSAKRKVGRGDAGSEAVVGLIDFYFEKVKPTLPSTLIEGLINMYRHDRAHAAKMLSVLVPVLEMLTSGEVGELLSPNRDDINDMRPIADIEKLVTSQKVVYFALDALSDPTVGAAVGKLILADLAAYAGDRYNYGDPVDELDIYIDEANELVNLPLVTLLNKSRGSGYRLHLFSQTINDIQAGIGDQARALQLLGNINNLICGRLKDEASQQYVVEHMDDVVIKQRMHTQNTTAMSSDTDFTNFTGGYGERLIEAEVPLMSAGLIGAMPNFEYIASLSGGRIVKGKFPIVVAA